MAKKIKIEDEIIEETEFYIVTKHKGRNGANYRVYNKNFDCFVYCSKYRIIKSALVCKNEFGSLLYYNHEVPQYYSEEDQEIECLELEELKSKHIDGKDLILIKYLDENFNIKEGMIDSDGNLKAVTIDELVGVIGVD